MSIPTLPPIPSTARPAARTAKSMTSTNDRRSAGTPPTVEDVRIGLRRTLGENFDTVWPDVCARLGVPSDTQTLPDDRFDDLLTAISGHDRLCHVLAMSWRIRRTAARKLAELGR